MVGILCPKRVADQFTITWGEKVYMTLGSPHSIKKIYNLHQLGKAFLIPELQLQTQVFLKLIFVVMLRTWNGTHSSCLLTHQLRHILICKFPFWIRIQITWTYINSRISVQQGSNLVEAKNPHEIVWIRIDNIILEAIVEQIPSYRERVPGFLNALFIVYKGSALYKLACVTILL